MHFTFQSRNEAYKNSAKIIQTFTVRAGGRSHRRPPPRIRHCLDIRELASIQHDLTVDALHNKLPVVGYTELVNILTSTRPILFHFFIA